MAELDFSDKVLPLIQSLTDGGLTPAALARSVGVHPESCMAVFILSESVLINKARGWWVPRFARSIVCSRQM